MKNGLSPAFHQFLIFFLFIKLFALICGVVWTTWVLLISKPLIPISLHFFRSHFADITTWNNREIITER